MPAQAAAPLGGRLAGDSSGALLLWLFDHAERDHIF